MLICIKSVILLLIIVKTADLAPINSVSSNLILNLLANPEIAVDSIKRIMDDEIAQEAFYVNSYFNITSGTVANIEKSIIVPVEKARSTVTTKIIPFLKDIGGLQNNSEVVTYLTNTMNVAVSLIDTSISNLHSSALNAINRGVDVFTKNTLSLSGSLSFVIVVESQNAISCAKRYFPIVLANGMNASRSIGSCAGIGLKRLEQNLKHSGLLARSINVMTDDLFRNLYKCANGSLDHTCISKILNAAGKDISAILKNTADLTSESSNNMSVFNKSFVTCVDSTADIINDSSTKLQNDINVCITK